MKIGIVIQARTGSKRMPNKVIMPFYKNESLLDIIISKLKATGIPIVLATSTNKKDEVLMQVANKHQILFFQGNENDVLKRFIDASEKFGFDTIVRVCADNPFIEINYLNRLVEAYKEKACDYFSFYTCDGQPTIKTHYGFFSELVELKTLKRIKTLTDEKVYHEHVTNYIYTNSDKFRIGILAFPFKEDADIRLTIDTQDDFDIVSKLYKKYHDGPIEILLSAIKSNKLLLNQMKIQVLRNSK